MEKNYIVKTLENTPFTIYNSDTAGVCILIGKSLIANNLESTEAAEEKIQNFTSDWPFLTSVIVGLVKVILEEKEMYDKIMPTETTINEMAEAKTITDKA
ncbi:MAG: hypothetical protein [Microviridae sp.]|nr:MAG: hypothetical protein [Microviridae sp.]